MIIKATLNKLFIISIFLILLLLSCEIEKNNISGKVTFYTNAQAVLNCGPFDEEIYMDSSLIGNLKETYLPFDDTPECNSTSSETLLVIAKPEGDYEFTARLTCSETLKYPGDFSVKKDSCTLVYIYLTYRLDSLL